MTVYKLRDQEPRLGGRVFVLLTGDATPRIGLYIKALRSWEIDFDVTDSHPDDLWKPIPMPAAAEFLEAETE